MLRYSGDRPPDDVSIVVIGAPKSGKSTLSATLLDWPNPGDRPVILAFDKSGPDALAQLGFRLPVLAVDDAPASDIETKTWHTIAYLRSLLAQKTEAGGRYTSVVVDCVSTMGEEFYARAMEDGFRTKDKRQAYGHILDWSNRVYAELRQLKVPIIWLGWLREPYRDQDQRLVLGGLEGVGSFRIKLSGRAQQILYLDKTKAPPNNDPSMYPPDAYGFIRQFRTKTFKSIECNGRFSNTLGDPAPAHLGYVLSVLKSAVVINPQQ